MGEVTSSTLVSGSMETLDDMTPEDRAYIMAAMLRGDVWREAPEAADRFPWTARPPQGGGAYACLNVEEVRVLFEEGYQAWADLADHNDRLFEAAQKAAGNPVS